MSTAILIAGAAFIAVAGLGIAFAGNGEQAKAATKRVKAVSAGKVNHRKVQDQQAQVKRRQNTQDALKQLAQNEKQSRQRRFSIQGRLLQAGLVNMKPAVFWIASAVLAVVGFLIGLIVQGWIGAVAGIVIAGLGLPRWVLGMMVNGRQKKFTSQLADAIDVIVRGVKSGLPLGQCLRIIAAESPEPIKGEFQVLVDGQAMGVPLDQSLQRLYDRMPLPEVNFFQIVLVIQQRTGGNLSESLGNLSSVLRSRKLMKEKVKALSSEAVASAMIIGSLPIIVMTLVYFTKPDYIMLLFTHPTGHLILMGASVMMGLGIFVMRNMVNFKF
jgi:tight adherence protein B